MTESEIRNITATKEDLSQPKQNQATSSFCLEILQELLEYILPE